MRKFEFFPFNLAGGALLIAAMLCWGVLASAGSNRQAGQDQQPNPSAPAQNNNAQNPSGNSSQPGVAVAPQSPNQGQQQNAPGNAQPNAPANANQQQQPSGPQEINTAELQHLFAKMHAVNQMEIKAGMLARQRGTTDMIRNYGDRLVMDHGFADDRLVYFAGLQKIPLPDSPKPLDPQEAQQMQQDQQTMQQLSQSQGKDFDQKFLTFMQQGHERVIAMLQQEAQKTRGSNVAGFLDKFIPILQQHETLSQHLGHSLMAKTTKSE
jgi:putative membrane protein